MKLEDMELEGEAYRAAKDLLEEFPHVIFTRGKRDRGSQAYDMTANVLRNPQWIAETYRASAPAKACQERIDSMTRPLHWGPVYAQLLLVLNEFSYEELAHLSRHFLGLAFDVMPDGNHDVALWLACRAEEIGGKFLETEGHLKIWHFQC